MSEFDRVVHDMPDREYHAVEAISVSGGKQILKSARHYRYWKDNPQEPTDAMLLGTATHLSILEPDRFETAIMVRPADLDGRTKLGKETLALMRMEAEKSGKIIITQEQRDDCMRMRDSVHAHAGARKLLSEGSRFEVSLFWRDAGFDVPCKARPDVLRTDGGIVDLKTAQDASENGFGRAIANFLYHMQAAHYISGCEHLFDATPPFFAFIAVENTAPFCCATYVMRPEQIVAGRVKMDLALSRYKIATERNEWPGYSDLIEEARMPEWALRVE